VEYEPLNNLLFQPGVRVIYNTKYKAPLIYSLNVKYGFKENYALRASFSRGFRAPSLKELYLYFVDVNHNIRGNEDLSSENSYNGNVNFSYQRETNLSFVSAELSMFYNYINNLITLALVGGDLYTYVNLDRKITQGAQFTLNYRLYPQLNTRVGAGVIGIHNSLSDELDRTRQFYYSPNAVASVSYRWMKYDIEFNLDYKYTGKLPQLQIDEEEQVFEGYVSHYSMMDFNVGKTFFKNILGVSAGVKNLFDITTIPSTGGSTGVAHSGGVSSVPVGWGRTFFIKATFNFRKI
jgi:outer membrane receptor for ferrienterochelin and colicins